MAVITATATFNGSSDTVAVTYTPTAATTPSVFAGDPIMTNPAAPMAIVWVAGAPTSTGCTIKASYAFTGSVNLIVLD